MDARNTPWVCYDPCEHHHQSSITPEPDSTLLLGQTLRTKLYKDDYDRRRLLFRGLHTQSYPYDVRESVVTSDGTQTSSCGFAALLDYYKEIAQQRTRLRSSTALAGHFFIFPIFYWYSCCTLYVIMFRFKNPQNHDNFVVHDDAQGKNFIATAGQPNTLA